MRIRFIWAIQNPLSMPKKNQKTKKSGNKKGSVLVEQSIRFLAKKNEYFKVYSKSKARRK